MDRDKPLYCRVRWISPVTGKIGNGRVLFCLPAVVEKMAEDMDRLCPDYVHWAATVDGEDSREN
jgi:hypothetical protein